VTAGLALPSALRSQVLALQAFQPVITSVQADPSQPVSSLKIAAVKAAGSPQLANLLRYAPAIVSAQQQAPKQWKTWWWICLGGQVIFLLLVFTMAGPWSPRRAKRDLDEREALVDRELAAIRAATPEPATA
jgi:hypothetical protein